MTQQRIKKSAGLVACLALGACGGGSPAAGGAAGPELSTGGEAASYAGPIASTDTEWGEEQFDVFCGTCHPDGEDDIGPTLLEKRFPPAFVRQMVREGSGRMRPISPDKLSDEDLEAVLAYMVGLDAVAAAVAEDDEAGTEM